jgi:hypothetical protein
MMVEVPPTNGPPSLLSRFPRLRQLLHSRWLMLLAAALALAVPAATLPSLPRVTVLPILLGLLPWVIGKYVLCPLRWHALSESGKSRRWHLRAYAEAELLGLLTPGHVGADIWRTKRLTRTGMHMPSAVAEVGLDRLVGALGLALFVGVAGAALPTSILVGAVALAVTALVAGLVLRKVRPSLLPKRSFPRPAKVLRGVGLSLGYQLTIGALLYGTVSATGHVLPPLALLGAFGASQIAGALPGPNGASPRDGALVLALMGMGLPWAAALGSVTLMTSVAWLPALLLGGTSLLLRRRADKRGPVGSAPALAVA